MKLRHLDNAKNLRLCCQSYFIKIPRSHSYKRFDALIYCEKMFVIPITSTKGTKNKRTTSLHFLHHLPGRLIPYTDVIHDILFSDDPTAQHTLSNITSQNCCLSKYHLCERYATKGVK